MMATADFTIEIDEKGLARLEAIVVRLERVAEKLDAAQPMTTVRFNGPHLSDPDSVIRDLARKSAPGL